MATAIRACAISSGRDDVVYLAPATEPYEALPLGNGQLGAMVRNVPGIRSDRLAFHLEPQEQELRENGVSGEIAETVGAKASCAKDGIYLATVGVGLSVTMRLLWDT